MPTYVFKCYEKKGGCGFSFERIMSMENAVSNKKIYCPECGKQKPVSRNYKEEHHNIQSDERQTLGTLAEKNAARLSEDEKAHLTAKHTEYKRKIPTKKLPDGFKYGKEILQKKE